MASKLFDADAGINLSTSVMEGSELGATFFTMFEPKEDVQRKQNEKRKKPSKRKKEKAILAEQLKRDANLVDDSYEKMLETGTPPSVFLHPNPSAFNVFANIRQCVLERRAKEALNMIRKQKTGDDDSESEDEADSKVKEPPAKMAKVVGMGLSSVFELIRETQESYPDLCQRALQALLDMLQGQLPESMKNEPPEVTGTLYTLLMDLTTSSSQKEKDRPLTCLACSCLISLVIAVGDTSKILSAVSALLRSSPILAAQSIQVPGILISLQRSIQAVLTGKKHIPEWRLSGIKETSLLTTLRQIEGIKGVKSSYSAMASDGKYLYIHSCKGLFKIGSGFDGSIKGHIYTRRENFRNREKGWLSHAQGTLFFQSYDEQATSVTAINVNTLVDEKTFKLGSDNCGPHSMFCDGEVIGHVLVTKDDSFVARMFSPSKSPMPMVSELPLRLSQKCVDVCGYALYDEERPLHSISTGFEKDVLEVGGAKDFALARTAAGKLLYTGKCSALGIKSGGPAPGKWTELVIPKAPKVVHFSVGHETSHAILVSDNGTAFFVGTAKRGEDADASLAKGRRQMKANKPKIMTKMDGKRVVSSACGAGASALVTDKGELYMFGKDLSYCDNNGFINDLREVRVSQVALGKAHVLVVTDKGELFTFGVNNKGQCGRDYMPGGSKEASMNVAMEDEKERDEDETEHGKFECPPGMHRWKHDECLICPSCGECSGYGKSCVSSSNTDRQAGTPCGCGLGDSGCSECGICKRCAGERDMDFNDPGMLMEFLASRGDMFRKGDMPPLEMLMSMGKGPRQLEMIARKMEERRYRRGRDKRHKLHGADGIPEYDDPKATSLSPAMTLVGSGKVKVKQVACGLNHSAVLLENGEVYTFGNNQYGQLGHGDVVVRGTPTRVPIDDPIVQVACGSFHTVLLTDDGRVSTFGYDVKGELGRLIPDATENGKKLSQLQSSSPGFIPELGPSCSRRASWIASYGSQTYIRVDESIINQATLAKSKVFANQSCIGIIPKDHPTVKCVMINRQDGTCKTFTENDQVCLSSSSVCMDPVYDNLWSYDTIKREVRCYNVVRSEYQNTGRELIQTQSPEIAVPVKMSSKVTRSHSALYLLAALDTLTKAEDLNLTVAEEKKVMQETKKLTLEDFLTVNRFESHGGGWGYSGHSVEAIRFSVDSDCILGGFGLFGGRGEYYGKIKLYELGPEGGENEVDGVVIAETDEVTYACPAREKYSLLFEEPVPLQANNWYAVWAKVSGPSSDCGSSGQSVITTEDQIVFKFKSSKKSNNGTDTNAGQIPLIYYKLPEIEAVMGKQSEAHEPAQILTRDFSRTVAPECFDSLLNLLNWSWSTFNGCIQDMQSLSGSSLKGMVLDLQRLVYICTASLHLLTSFICKVYPKTGNTKHLPNETSRIADCVCETRAAVHCILAEHIPLPPAKITVSQGIKEHARLADNILHACHRTFTMCFHAFYPTGSLKWLCLCDLLSSTNQQDEDLGGCAQQLAAVMDALSHPSVKLLSILPINAEHGKEHYLRQFSKDDNNSSSEVYQYPVLVEHMLTRTEMEGGASTQSSFKEILDRLMHIVTLPVRQTIRGEQVTYPDNMVANTCALLTSIIQELSASATWLEADLTSASRPLLTTPNRFTRTSSNAFWNAGNGSPDAVTFTVDRPGIVVAGVTVYGGTGRYEYELELLDDRSDTGHNASHAQRWNSLGMVKGSFNTEDCVTDIAEIKLERPVPIKEGVKYAFRLRNSGAKTLNGDGGMGKVKCPDGTTFTFTACSLSTNGTSHTRGQLPQILYYSTPDGDDDEDTCRLLVEYQSRKNAVNIASSVIRGAADLFIRAQNMQGDERLLQKVGSAHMFSALLPMVLAYIGPVASQDPRSAVQVLALVQHILPPVSSLSQSQASPPGSRRSSFSGDNGHDSTTSQHYAIVESDHPYKPATVTNYKVTFPDTVKWMTIEFDPQSSTAQFEDCLWLYVPVKPSLRQKPVAVKEGIEELKSQWKILDKFSGTASWPKKVVIIPGNDVTFSLETASDYAKNDKASFYGFKCTVLGYEWTNKISEGIPLLEKEISYLGGMCAAAIMRQDMTLPASSSEEIEEDLHLIDEGAKKIFQEHKGLLSKGYALSQPPTVSQALEGTLPLDIHSNERSFLNDFISCTQNTTGGRLARWLQPESHLDPKQCEIVYNKEDMRCNWPCTVTIQMKDQYCNPVNVPNVKVVVKAVPIERTEGDDENQPYQIGGSILYGGQHPPNVDIPYRVSVKDNKDNFHAITMMPEYDNYSFEELRFTSPGSRRPSENMTVRPNHDGTLTANWTPSSTGWYNIHVSIDGYTTGEIYRVEVRDPPVGVAPPSQSQAKKQVRRPKKLRKFVAKYTAGLRIRLSPSLQGEMVGTIKPEGVIEFVDELHNDDGVWLKLSSDSTKDWCSNGYTEAWCLQYNQVLGKTLMVPVEEPKSIMDEMVKEAMKKSKPELVAPPEKLQPEKPKDGSGVYIVMNCGPSGHNIRMSNDMRASAIGVLSKGDKVVAKNVVNSMAGIWIQLTKDSIDQYCHDTNGDGYILIETKNRDKVFLRHETELFDPVSVEPTDPFAVSEQPSATVKGFDFGTASQSAPSFPVFGQAPKEASPLPPFTASTDPLPTPPIVGSIADPPEPPTVSIDPTPSLPTPKPADSPRASSESPQSGQNATSDDQEQGVNVKELIKALGKPQGGIAQSLRMDRLMQRRAGSESLANANGATPGVTPTSTPPETPKKSSRSSSPKHSSDSSKSASPSLNLKSSSLEYRRQSTSEWVTPPSTPPVVSTPPLLKKNLSGSKDLGQGEPNIFGKEESRDRSPKSSPRRRISSSPRHGSPAKGDPRYHRESSASPSRTAATQTSPPPEPPFGIFNIGAGGSPKKEDTARMSPKLSRKGSRSQSLRSRRDGRSSSPVPQAKPSALKSTTPMQQKAVINAMTPSVAECLRTVFAAFLWHEGIVHDAMACASFLKFHPNLAKEMPSGSTFVFDIKETPTKQADGTKNNQNENISNPEKMTNKEGGSDQLDADTSPKHGQASRKTVHFNINLPPEGKKNGDKQIKKERHKSEGSFLTKLSSQDDDLPSSPSSMTKRSELLPTLKHLVYFWEAMTSATIRAVQEKSITPSPAMEVYKPRDRYDLQRMMMDRKELRMMGMKFGEMSDFGLLGGANKDRETMCDLCGGMYPHPVTYHMRKAHHGCGNPAGGQGYNSGGIFCGGWAGSCGDGGIGGSSWYLICHQCREGYLKEKRDLMAKESYRGGRRGRKVKSKPISNHPPLEAHHIMTNNALFLLNLASSSGVNFSSNKSHDAIMSAMTRTDSYLPSVSEESFLLDQPAFPLVPFQYLSQRGADDADSAFNEEVVVAQDGDKIHTIKAESLGPGPRSFEMRHRLRQAYLAGMFDPKKELKSPGTSPSRNRHSAEVSAESSSAVKQAVLTRSISEVRPSGPQAEGSITDGFDLMGNTSRRTSFRRRNISGDSGLSLLKNPSVAMSRLIRSTEKGGRSKTMSEKAMQRPVMTFVLQHHDLGNLQLAMKQSIRKAALRVHALQALNWLVRTVTQPVCLHDLLWYFIMAFTPLYPDYAEEDRERENRKDRKEPFKEGELYSWLSVCEHPKQDISLAGEAAQPLETNFHGFLQTISDVMMHLPQGSALQQMAVRCWSFKFKPSDHQFLHKSHVFSNISKILSKSEGEDDELNGHVNDFAPVTSFVECLKDLTSKAELKVSSRFAMATSLTDNSTETFWESGDEDKNKTKTITITMPSRNNPKVVYVHIDNSRDLGSKVSSLVFSVGTSVEDLKSKYKQMDIEARHAGWISCHITEADCSVVRLELRGPDNHLRVRQVKILGEVQGESMKIGKQLNVLAAQEKKCESETLRVFRLLTSEVFGRLISEKSEVPELPRSDSKEDLEEAASEAETDLKEHMVGILFSRKGLTLTHLQKQVCEHIVQQIRKETFRVREEWENGLKMADPFTEETRTTDAYCFELLSMVLALSGSKVGCIFIAKQHDLLHDLLSLLHTGTPRVQRQVTALLRRVLPEVLPHLFARNLQIHTLPAKDVSVLLDNTEGQSSADFNAYTERILDVFLACIAKSLTVQMKSKKAITSVMLLDSPLKQGTGKQRWYLKGHISDKLATEIIRLLKDMASGKLSDEWAIVTKAAIAEAILNLTKLEEDQRTPAECIKIPTLWLALASLCVLDQDHTERLSSGQWVKGDGTPSTPRPTCDNHDDGQTPAIILCAECGNLCADCDRFLHLPQKKRSHQRQIFKEEEEAIKVDLHEGCGRTKLFWILALADSKTLKALVEFREGTKSKAKPLPFATGTCRFCGTTSKSGLLAVGNVCSDPDCQEYSKYACTKTLPCGHLCGGIKGEETCLPCLNGCSKDVSLKQDADDMCMICFTEALNAAPAVQLQCGHVFHHQCSRNILDKRWVGPRITFGFSLCPICKVPIDHPVLKDLLDPIRSLQDDVRRKALMRLEYEGLHKAEAITTVGARFHNDPAGFAMERYSYYVCFKCKKAYYGGEARCDEEAGISEDYNPAELVCGGCSDVSRAQMCPKHGMDFLEYKCRYCCSVAVFFCFGTTHFCNACHDDFQRVTNVPKSLLPHCPAGPRGKQLEGDECPLHVQHPATGEEFALGCGVCRNAHTF